MRPIQCAALLVAAAAAACAQRTPFRASERNPTKVATVDSTVLVVLDENLEGAIELLDHREQVLPDGRLRAQLRLVNHGSHDLHVQVAWTFKDDRGFPVEEESPFEHTMVASGQTLSLTRDSMQPGATAFHVQVKSATPKK
jgi:hypothetical protein